MTLYQRHVVGRDGERLACVYLEERGYSVVERNYRKKWGEIDIIAVKEKVIYFVEVKSISCKNIDAAVRDVNGYRPEENIHPQKLKRLGRTIQTYLVDRKVAHETSWQLDALIVFIDKKNLRARIRSIENIILSE